jgi:heavy metal translocating P-type ATPase
VIPILNWTPRIINRATLALALGGTIAGIFAYVFGAPGVAVICWAATTILALAPLTASVISALRQGKLGVDIIALLAMVGALLLNQFLAGAVIALMLTGGQALERYADSRARRELSSLLQRAPRIAYRIDGESIASVSVDDVAIGDLLLVKPGEVVPVNGVVVGATAVLDESALTGVAVPAERRAGEQVNSGVVNSAREPFRMRATAAARDSTYAGIVRLVEQAQAAKAPLVRLADQYSMWFLPIAVGGAILAWLISGQPMRALAVLVVATPCPLILAAPVAIVSGISRAARRGVIVKGGGALEALARCEVLVLDKTGTVTGGSPVITEVESFGKHSEDELLRFAASLDQISPHVLAQPILNAANQRGLTLSFPSGAKEEFGSGIQGMVDGHQIKLGRSGWVLGSGLMPSQLRRLRRRTAMEGSSSVVISVDGEIAGALILEDPIRADAPLTLRSLRQLGFRKIFLLTGDHEDVATVVGGVLGIDQVFAERTPAEKVTAVEEVRRDGMTVMVGDGINDAPALAAADVGVALGARGASASSEAADIVLLLDRIDGLAESVRIARRSRRIALESIFAGMGLSAIGMIAAGFGFLPPVAGALLQEGIDVAVILNALRALGEGSKPWEPSTVLSGIVQQIREEHRRLLPGIQRLRALADRLDVLPAVEAQGELSKARRFLTDEILPHDQSEDAEFYPLAAKALGGSDPMRIMVRQHVEILHLVNLFGRIVDELPPDGPDAEDMRELRRILYALHTILSLHFAQEDESYLAILDTGGNERWDVRSRVGMKSI